MSTPAVTKSSQQLLYKGDDFIPFMRAVVSPGRAFPNRRHGGQAYINLELASSPMIKHSALAPPIF